MNISNNISSPQPEVNDQELREVIADFLEMGHVENILAMFKQEPRYYAWTGKLLEDERFAVRLGVSVLFEYLREDRPDDLYLALPSLATALTNKNSWVRGEAASVLDLIGSPEAFSLIKTCIDDPAPEVASLIQEILTQHEE